MKFGVIVFPGSNCDNDAFNLLKNVLNVSVKFIWHKETNLSNVDALVIPGGFSYGDYLRAGAIARFSPIMNEVVKHGEKGMPIIGICNGFQILTESDLLPGTLMVNKTVKFISKNVKLRTITNSSVFTKNLKVNEMINMPIAHKQGNYNAKDYIIKSLIDNDQIAFKYDENPNGSIDNIAGILNKQRNVLGMMPHPERASESILGSKTGIKIFESLIGSL
tara:strand:- start:664 stop:1323 length:660 start_codon:yes stop_codon:yes gene_type:complete